MDRRAKVELFEEIRREYEFGIGSLRAATTRAFGLLEGRCFIREWHDLIDIGHAAIRL